MTVMIAEGNRSLAALSSASSPGTVIVRALDLAATLRPRRGPIIGTFHSPLERSFLRILLNTTNEGRDGCPIVGILPFRPKSYPVRLPRDWKAAAASGRLSPVPLYPYPPFHPPVLAPNAYTEKPGRRVMLGARLPREPNTSTEGPHRRTEETCMLANRLACLWALEGTLDGPQKGPGSVLILHASPGGKVENLVKELAGRSESNGRLFALQDESNDHLWPLGVTPFIV